MTASATCPPNPVEFLLSFLHGARPCGQGKWRAYCPAHEDPPDGHRPSLDVTERAGKPLFVCRAGCAQEAVVAALRKRGWHSQPETPGPSRHRHSSKGRQRVYRTPDEAAGALARIHGGTFIGMWVYHNADGSESFRVVRINLPNDTGKSRVPKKYLPIRPVSGGWVNEDPPGPLPLYRLADLDGAPRVWIVEGEGCADAAAGVGLVATTSAHGAKSAAKSDWTPLAGRDVVILPDNDEADRRYAADVAAILMRLTPPATVRVVDLPGLPEHGDIVDYLDGRDAQAPEDLRREIESLADAAPVRMPDADPDADDGPRPTFKSVRQLMADHPAAWARSRRARSSMPRCRRAS